ncbi:MAG: hypothetical protein IKR18_07540 [Bacteroidaceae bacterium]|nr:hypothetical protein [Bacteroidaceae bacterium]
MKTTLIYILLLIVASSCANYNDDTEIIERLKTIGNDDPQLALRMLDSMCIDVPSKPMEIQMRYELLNIRLRDKAFIPATSDVKIKKVVDYFSTRGNNYDIQEALYYAGSVYRDLNDTPRALRYFLEAKSRCESDAPFDSLILRNTYSNLNDLYYRVQDYRNALSMALEEYELSNTLHKQNTTTILNVATALIRLNKIPEAKAKFLEAMKTLKKRNIDDYSQELYSLFYHFAKLRMKKEAELCYKKIISENLQPDYADARLAMAEYFLLLEENDSAAHYFRSILTMPDNHEGKYDACRHLVKLYNSLGNKELAAHYADLFVKVCDTLNLGERQLQAATVNNKYQYYKNEIEEKEQKEREAKYRQTAWGVAIAASIVILLLLVFTLYRRNARLRQIIEKDRELLSATKEIEELEASIVSKDGELGKMKELYRQTNENLDDVKRKIKETEIEVSKKEQLLSEKIRQNQSFIKLLHQSELTDRGDDVISRVRHSADGQCLLTPDEWNMLLNAVDKQYPDFSKTLAQNIGRANEQEIQVCYLMKIGLTNAQIKNLTFLPRTTIWRWTKKFDWIVADSERKSD